MNRILHVLDAISDQGNAILSKTFIYVGVSGSSVGVASGIAKRTTDLSSDMLTLSEWGSVCGIVGGLALAIKSCSDVYFNYKKDKREQQAALNKVDE